MNLDILWELFQKTGNISYYNLWKKIKGDVDEKERYDKKSSNVRDNS